MPASAIAQVVQSIDAPVSDDLVVGTEAFSDAAVFRLRDDLFIAQSLDFFAPVVDDPFSYGQIAAANSLSDIYAMGAIPRTAMNIVGFPDDKLPLDVLTEILAGGTERIRESGAVLAGGHTVRDAEIKYGLSVTGVVHPDDLLTNAAAQPGDSLYLTKSLGTGFITTGHKYGKCREESYRAAIESMSELNAAASRIAKLHRASAVTDITGFGLAGHAREMAYGSNVTLQIVVDSLPELPGALDLAAKGMVTRASKSNLSAVEKYMDRQNRDAAKEPLLFDPQTSGGLLIAISPAQESAFAEDLSNECLTAAKIGEVLPAGPSQLVIN